jgi:hypothetical protein
VRIDLGFDLDELTRPPELVDDPTLTEARTEFAAQAAAGATA